MSRVDNWPARLNAFVERRRRMPFRWGVHDCCQFARAAVAELRGTDPASGLALRQYRRSSGAARLLRRLGGADALPGACGLAAIPVTQAGRGDLVCYEVNRPALGICLGAKSAFPGGHALVFIATLECQRAWKV